MDAVGPGGTVMGYASSDRSPYEETLNGARMDKALRRDWPAFDPRIAGTYRGFGLLNRFLADLPGARRSAHPDASMVAVGPLAGTLVEPHRLGQALGEGAPLDAVTVLHYAEAVADIPGKRRISYDTGALRRFIAEDLRATAQIKRNRSRAGSRPLDRALYEERHLVECFFNQIKRFRRITLRCEKTATSFKAFVELACAMAWIA